MRIRYYASSDDPEWLRMRCALWPEDTPEVHRSGMAVWLARSETVVIVAERPDGAGLAGFAEVGSRSYADSCDTSPVAYLEGWYVDEDMRRRGIGTALVRAAEVWARERGYREFASDARLDNTVSHRAHESLGFIEVERAVLYRKRI